MKRTVWALILWLSVCGAADAGTRTEIHAKRVHVVRRVHHRKAAVTRATRASMIRWHRGGAPRSPASELRETLGMRGGAPDTAAKKP